MRNFPKLQLLIFFLQFSKQKYSYLWGGSCGENFEIIHAIDMQTNKKDTSILLDLCANTLSPAWLSD